MNACKFGTISLTDDAQIRMLKKTLSGQIVLPLGEYVVTTPGFVIVPSKMSFALYQKAKPSAA